MADTKHPKKDTGETFTDKLSIQELREKYIDTVKSLPGLDREGRKIAADYLCNSEAVYQGEVTDFLYVPKFYTCREREHFQEIATVTCSIMKKIIDAYVAIPEYRSVFGFSPELEKLILVDPGYESAIPMLRADIFYNEDTGDFKFCEFNTDGSSAMNEDREITNALSLTPAYRKFASNLAARGYHLDSFELFASWIEAFMKVYKQSTKTKSREVNSSRFEAVSTNVVITDFLDMTTPVELDRFAQHFEDYGACAEICDIRDLRFDAGAATGPALLSPSGMKVDAVYRRAVTGDIMRHYDEVTDFLDAYRAGAFTLIGSFRTQLAHTKLSFEVMHLPQTLALLNQSEIEFIRAHVPYTVRLQDKLSELSEIIANRHDWIIKPLDGYGSKGVWAGREVDQDTWEELVIRACAEQDHIAQHYVEQYVADNLESGFDLPAGKTASEQKVRPQIHKYRDLTGLFIYDGIFTGLLARAGQQDRICAAAAGKTLATFSVKKSSTI